MSTETTALSLNVNDEVTKAVNAALTTDDIRAAVIAEAEKQTATATASAQADVDAVKAVADKAAADAAAAKTASAGFTRTEVIRGQSFTFEADTELEVERMVSNALRVAHAIQPNESTRSEVDPAAEAAAAAAAVKQAEADAVVKVELEQGFRNGTISASEYIKRSGVLKEYLAAEGVSIDVLKETVNHNVNQKEIQSWADAAEIFKNSPAGDTWPGGEKNQAILGDIISARPDLLNATDKVMAMGAAYAEMKRRGTIFSNDSTTVPTEAEKTAAAQAAAAKVIADKAAADAAALAEANRKNASTSSSLFSRSSGVATTTTTISPASKVDVPADASPAEIMDAWKKAMVAQGKNPDDAFMDQYRNHRI